MKYNLIIYIILIFAVSCNSSSENLNSVSDAENNAVIGDWQGFKNFHVGGEHYEMMYLIRDFRITKDSLYEIKYPTSFMNKYKINYSKDSIFLEKDGITLDYKWSINGSILTLRTTTDTTRYFRSKFTESYFNKIESDSINTTILDKHIWRFDYQNTSRSGWKNIDTMIYNPHRTIDFMKMDYKLNTGAEITIESDTFKIVRFQKSYFIADSDRYLLQLQKIIGRDTAILTYQTP